MRFIKKYDERKGKERAEEVTGGSPEEEWRGGGGDSGDGGEAKPRTPTEEQPDERTGGEELAEAAPEEK